MTAYAFMPPNAMQAAESASLLTGKVVSSTGEPLAGIPIKAHRDNSAITVAVYTDAKGEYSFPTWSDLTPGSYSVGVELPDFEQTAQPVAVAAGKPAKVDFTLKAKPLAYEDATDFRDHRRPSRHRSAEGAVLPMRQLPHAAMGAGRPASAGKIGSGSSRRWRAVLPRSTSRAPMRSARCSSSNLWRTIWSRSADLTPPTTSRSSNGHGRPMRPPPISS